MRVALTSPPHPRHAAAALHPAQLRPHRTPFSFGPAMALSLEQLWRRRHPHSARPHRAQGGSKPSSSELQRKARMDSVENHQLRHCRKETSASTTGSSHPSSIKSPAPAHPHPQREKSFTQIQRQAGNMAPPIACYLRRLTVHAARNGHGPAIGRHQQLLVDSARVMMLLGAITLTHQLGRSGPSSANVELEPLFIGLILWLLGAALAMLGLVAPRFPRLAAACANIVAALRYYLLGGL
ncbi:hypothetical protein HU200_042596 [Digitaria exilis]|uniref:Uncharacterized protein n=1 Tax=Digitaria exilis TaxID=1010633 RepID=A0A835B4E8_9POAL|nr:hypothetical protein HU200_042596 [Digitaria exilis]